MSTLTIYTEKESVRLTYVLNWLFKEQLGLSYVLTHTLSDIGKNTPAITYGKQVENAICIPDHLLLWETGEVNAKLNYNISKWSDIPTLFADEVYTIPFDIFSAIFFLLSRYEEYYPYTGDKHGRYPATESILYKNSWLERPIVDEWLNTFRKFLTAQFPSIEISTPKFSYHPTYDIDIAWSYKHKGVKRTAGAFAKDLLKGNSNQIAERIAVLRNKKVDPYDSYTWLQYLHRKYNLKPTYFMLLAKHVGEFDKNIDPENSYLQKLIKDLSNEGSIGIHPSYYSNNNCQQAAAEQNVLQNILGHKVCLSRQHYIRNTIPDTYRCLVANDITDDHSMGYGTHIGFRAGTGTSFLWYDLENEHISSLRIHPFCFMDTTAHYDNEMNVQLAFEKLEALKIKLQKVNAPLTTVFHNFSLGSAKEWLGWREDYELFVKGL